MRGDKDTTINDGWAGEERTGIKELSDWCLDGFPVGGGTSPRGGATGGGQAIGGTNDGISRLVDDLPLKADVLPTCQPCNAPMPPYAGIKTGTIEGFGEVIGPPDFNIGGVPPFGYVPWGGENA